MQLSTVKFAHACSQINAIIWQDLETYCLTICSSEDIDLSFQEGNVLEMKEIRTDKLGVCKALSA